MKVQWTHRLRDGVELNYNYGGTNHMAGRSVCCEAVQAGLKTANELGVTILTGTKGKTLLWMVRK